MCVTKRACVLTASSAKIKANLGQKVGMFVSRKEHPVHALMSRGLSVRLFTHAVKLDNRLVGTWKQLLWDVQIL